VCPTFYRARIHFLPIIFADTLLMKQVFTNYLSNALKYSQTQTNPSIEIMVEISDSIKVIFKDNGCGFDKNLSKNLFKPFHRLHTGFKGVGIGLVVVKTIIEKHEGGVFAYNNRNGGASFGFYLPLNSLIK
jgi:two-component system, sensor histidine kinase and response regulator